MIDSGNLRTRLRSDLTEVHATLDSQISAFDLRTRTGFASFLRIQHGGLSALHHAGAGDLTRDAIADLQDRARLDLLTLGVPPLTRAETLPGDLHPLAVDYVIAGSRLGSQLLHKRWLSSDDTAVRAASAYFSAPGHIDLWKAFCGRAAALPAEGPESDRILRHAAAIFALFGHHAAAETQERALPHV